MIFAFFSKTVMAILRANPLTIGVTGLCTREVSYIPNFWYRVHTVDLCFFNLQQGNYLTNYKRQSATVNNE